MELTITGECNKTELAAALRELADEFEGNECTSGTIGYSTLSYSIDFDEDEDMEEMYKVCLIFYAEDGSEIEDCYLEDFISWGEIDATERFYYIKKDDIDPMVDNNETVKVVAFLELWKQDSNHNEEWMNTITNRIVWEK